MDEAANCRRQPSGYEVDTCQQAPKTPLVMVRTGWLTGSKKPFGNSRPLDMAPHIAARCRLQPKWLPVVALPRGPGGVVEVMVNAGEVCVVGLTVSGMSFPQTRGLALTHAHTRTHTL